MDRAADTKHAASTSGGAREYSLGQHALSGQVSLDPLGEGAADPRRGGNIVGRGLADATDAAEPLEQRLLPARTDTLDLVELAAQRLAAAHLAVVGDREPMRLVADALHEVQGLRAARQHDRLGAVGHEDLLESLREPRDRNL